MNEIVALFDSETDSNFEVKTDIVNGSMRMIEENKINLEDEHKDLEAFKSPNKATETHLFEAVYQFMDPDDTKIGQCIEIILYTDRVC